MLDRQEVSKYFLALHFLQYSILYIITTYTNTPTMQSTLWIVVVLESARSGTAERGVRSSQYHVTRTSGWRSILRNWRSLLRSRRKVDLDTDRCVYRFAQTGVHSYSAFSWVCSRLLLRQTDRQTDSIVSMLLPLRRSEPDQRRDGSFHSCTGLCVAGKTVIPR